MCWVVKCHNSSVALIQHSDSICNTSCGRSHCSRGQRERRKWQTHKESVTELCRLVEQTAKRIWKKASARSSLKNFFHPSLLSPSLTLTAFSFLALLLSHLNKDIQCITTIKKKVISVSTHGCCYGHSNKPDCAASLHTEWVSVWDVLMPLHAHCVKSMRKHTQAPASLLTAVQI